MVEEEQWDDAEVALKEALRLTANNTRSWLYLAWMKLEYYAALPDKAGVNALEEAVTASRRVLDKDPMNVTALGYQGVALRRLKRFPEAVEALELALELQPDNYVQWSNLGALHLLLHELEKAEHCLRKGADYAGQAKDDAYRYRAMAWRNLATFELFLRKNEAVEHIAKSLESHGDDVLSWVIRARNQLELKDHLNVRKALDDAKYADRAAKFRDPRAKRVLSLAYLRNDQFDDAVNEARAAIELKDAPTANHLIIAIAEAKRGQVRAARDALAAAESAWPEQLKKPGEYIASAETGDLWIESADGLIQLKAEVEAAIATAPGSQP
jgi:tetratricopeptide (TPR) repeat protein